uniref:P13 n=1 Tax=Olivavirus actinidiae TaxID=2024724 RepID=A0A7L9CDQ4_9CLOS|nr:P13 [Actinidia virus 1]QOJ38400.1 P13 [Actinidia virus 1]
MGIVNSLHEPDYTSRVFDQYDQYTDNRWRLPHAGCYSFRRTSDCFPGGSHMVDDRSVNNLMMQYNYRDLESQLSYKSRVVSELLMERENYYKEEMHKRDECYARHKRRSKKRFSLYSLLYR